MNYDEMRAFQLGEEGHDEPRALVFSGEDLDKFEPEAMKLAMERDMADREDYWRRQALVAEGLVVLEETDADSD